MDLTFVSAPLSVLPKEKQPQDKDLYKRYVEDETIKNPTIKSWQGYYFYPLFEPETAKYAYNEWQPRKGDVLVATQVKSGTTWTRELVRQIIYLNDEEILKSSELINFVFAYLECGPVSKYQVMDDLPFPRRIFGTHLPPQLVNFDKMKKAGVQIIYVIRNPKDQAASWYPFVRKLPHAQTEAFKEFLPVDKKEFMDKYIAGEQKFFNKDGEIFLEPVRQWYKHKDDDNVLVLMYENMKKDIKKEVRRIAQFIDVALNDKEIDRVCENSSLENMRKSWSRAEMPPPIYFRKGQVGDWKNHLTVSQSERIDELVEEVFGDTDLRFIYELDEASK